LLAIFGIPSATILVAVLIDESRLHDVSGRWPKVLAGQTKAEVISVLGQPNSIHPARTLPLLGDSNETWSFGRRFFRLSSSPPFLHPVVLEQRVLAPFPEDYWIEFNANGIVVSKGQAAAPQKFRASYPD
jgi:hypothetical protein